MSATFQVPVYSLRTPIELTLRCPCCESDQRIFFDRCCEYGNIGECVNCGTEWIAVFTRETGEAA
jgi:hypothetical protein